MVRPARKVSSAQVPQKESLAVVRRVVHGCDQGFITTDDLARWTGLSKRHARYAVRAACVLGWIREHGDESEPTNLGRALLRTTEGGRAERSRFRQSIEESPIVAALAPRLLGAKAPSAEVIVTRIQKHTDLSESTAKRRANTLLAWRKQALEPSQLGIEWQTEQQVPSGPVLRPDLVRVIRRLNPWWDGAPGPELPRHERNFVERVRSAFGERLAPITVVRGPRQVGKTTAQLQVIERLLSDGVPAKNILRVQFDELPSLMGLHEPVLTVIDWYQQNVLEDSINAVVRESGAVYLFLDEAQNIKSWHVELKHLVDTTSVNIFATGSSAFRIELGRDSLAGRVRTIEIGTLTLREVSRIALGENLPSAGGEIGSMASQEFWNHLREHGERHSKVRNEAFDLFAERGGYPFVYRARHVEWSDIAQQLNENVVKRVLRHDLRIGDRGRQRDYSLLESTFRLACRYAGQAPEYRSLAQETSTNLDVAVKGNRIREYLKFLDSALLLHLVEPLEMRAKRSGRAAKLCLIDHALRAALLNELVSLNEDREDRTSLVGHLAESIVGSFLSGLAGCQLAHYPAKKGRLEVDFVMIVGSRRVPIEVKYVNRKLCEDDGRGLRAFMDKRANNAGFGVIVTRKPSKVADKRIVCLPLSSLLLL